MKDSTSAILHLLGGAIIGSAVTCIMCNKKQFKKMGGLKKEDIHKKIIAELEQLRQFVATHHPGEVCSCEDPACNCEKE